MKTQSPGESNQPKRQWNKQTLTKNANVDQECVKNMRAPKKGMTIVMRNVHWVEKNNHCLWPVGGVGFSVFPWEGVIGKLRGVPDKYFFIQPFLYCTWKNWFWSLLSKSSLGLFWCVYNIWYMINQISSLWSSRDWELTPYLSSCHSLGVGGQLLAWPTPRAGLAINIWNKSSWWTWMGGGVCY